ncbi:hypothetical protein [Nocardioides caldifontis]|uniref:hypothetical protein n=1 Tax=Nocardioides caldifontis TaxID=2588938 RepID=UPI0011DFCBDA|nr:hypothetical protein [Nocardioides caldifontis]
MSENATAGSAWRTLRTTALSAAAGAVLCTLAAGQVGSAAQLRVTATPIQFWDLKVQVELPHEVVDELTQDGDTDSAPLPEAPSVDDPGAGGSTGGDTGNGGGEDSGDGGGNAGDGDAGTDGGPDGEDTPVPQPGGDTGHPDADEVPHPPAAPEPAQDSAVDAAADGPGQVSQATGAE